MKFSTIIIGAIIGVVLFSWSTASIAASSKKISNYTEAKIGKKVLLNKDKQKAGTIEDAVWKYFNALTEENIEKAKSLASKQYKTYLTLEHIKNHNFAMVKKRDFDFKKDFYIKISESDDKCNCVLYGYSKKSKREKKMRFYITIEDGKAVVGAVNEPLFR